MKKILIKCCGECPYGEIRVGVMTPDNKTTYRCTEIAKENAEWVDADVLPAYCPLEDA